MRRYNSIADTIDMYTFVSRGENTFINERLTREGRCIPSLLYNTTPSDKLGDGELSRNLKCLDRSFNVIAVRALDLTPYIKSPFLGVELSETNVEQLEIIPKYKILKVLSWDTSLLKHIPTDRNLKVRSMAVQLKTEQYHSVTALHDTVIKVKEMTRTFGVKHLYFIVKPTDYLYAVLSRFENMMSGNITFIVDLRVAEQSKEGGGLVKCIEEDGYSFYLPVHNELRQLENVNQFIYQEQGFNYFYKVRDLGYSTPYNIIYYTNGRKNELTTFSFNIFNIMEVLD